MKIAYRLYKFELTDKTLYAYKICNDVQAIVKNGKETFVTESGTEYPRNRYYELTTTLPIGAINVDLLYMPYFADVIQDLPMSSRKLIKPKVYKNCQLMTVKHGGYLKFKHHKSGEELIIALNSNSYRPVTVGP